VGLTLALAAAAFVLPRNVLSEVERDAAGAVGTDNSKLTQDQRELLEFKATLAALDDALMRNHLENYYTLNNRLGKMMERELRQSSERLRAAEEAQKQQRAAQRMRATMGSSGIEFLDLDRDPSPVQTEQLDIASAKERAKEMRQILERFDALQVNLHEQDTRAYARNAALLDKFLELMRAEGVTTSNVADTRK